ncbi:MAG: T9SS type A sorting domain-containing protein [Bacteroidia bacterium]|nr:T9SS type A sorting domain-containing protein [Bacteroidia bacterium]
MKNSTIKHRRRISKQIVLTAVLLCNLSIHAEELLLKYDFTNGSNLPTTKHIRIYAGNEFGVFNTTEIPLEMTLQSGVDYLLVKDSATAVKQDCYGYLSIGIEKGYTCLLSRVEITSKKGNSNTQNARSYLYDSLKNTPTILNNVICNGSKTGYTIPAAWETKSFSPLSGPQTINDTVYFSFASTQVLGSGVPAEWYIDQISFYGTIGDGTEVINDVTIEVYASKPKHVVSKLLNGSHFVYGNEPDTIYKDERIADWMRSSKVGIIRWPGGTAVMTYHWDDLTGDSFGPDLWDKANYIEQNISPSLYMDLDEYIAYCRRVNAEPMVGVNIKSGKQFKTDAAGLDEARRLIQYCVDKNYHVKHWYIGNEGYAKGFSETTYGNYIDKYAVELKKVDPNIIIIGDWKFGPESANRYKELVTIVKGSSQIDVIEVHEKWGNGFGLNTGSNNVAEWKNEFPLYDGKLDYYCKKFATDMKNLGKTTKLSMNEWGIGGMANGNDYDFALLAADYMTQMFQNDIYSACYWNMNAGGIDYARIFVTKNNDQEVDSLNPVSRVFKQYAPMLGNNFLEVVSSDKQVYGVASINATKDTIQVLLLNKSAQKSKVKFSINEFEANNTVLKDWFTELGSSKIEEVDKGDLSYVLPDYSFSRLQFTGRSTTAIAQVKSKVSEMTVIKNNSELKIELPDNDLVKTACVLNMQGVMVKNVKLSVTNNRITIGVLKQGVYCLRVTGEKRNYVTKIIY